MSCTFPVGLPKLWFSCRFTDREPEAHPSDNVVTPVLPFPESPGVVGNRPRPRTVPVPDPFLSPSVLCSGNHRPARGNDLSPTPTSTGSTSPTIAPSVRPLEVVDVDLACPVGGRSRVR